MSNVKLVVEEVNATTGANVNTRVIVPLKSKVTNNGTRSADVGEFTIPITGVIGQNDIVSYIQDVVDTQSLVSIYNFKHSARDEGGFDLDGDDRTFTADFAKETLNKFDDHYHIQFNAAGEEVTVSHTERHDFTGTFDIMCHYHADGIHFAGNSNGKEQCLFSKWDSAGGGNGVMIGLQYDTTNGWDVWAKVRTGGVDTELFTTSFLELGSASPAFIRLCRDENNLVSLYLGDTLQDSATVPGSFGAASTDSIIGSDNGGTLDYSGNIYQLRIYNSNLSDANAELVRTAKPQWSTMKLRARVWKIKENTSNKVISVRSDNQILFKTELNKISMDATALPSPATSSRTLNVFKSSENSDDIIQDILGKIDENILFARGGGAGSAPIAKYIATGSLLKNIEILSVFNQNVFWFNARQVLILEDPQPCRLRYDHGLGYRITSTGKDDSTTVNDLEATGNNVMKTDIDTSATNVSSMTTSHPPLNVRVQLSSGTYLFDPSGFSVDVEKSTITFASPTGVGITASAYYDYEDGSNLISRKLGTNIAGIGTYARRVIIPQLTDISNLNTFTSNFVTGTGVGREDINERYKVIAPLLVNSIRENIKPTVKNTIKSIDTTATIKSITYEYPSMRTTIEIGEHMFDSFDLRKRLVESDESAADNTLKTKNI